MSKANKTTNVKKISKVNRTSKMTRVLALVLASLLFLGVAAGLIAKIMS